VLLLAAAALGLGVAASVALGASDEHADHEAAGSPHGEAAARPRFEAPAPGSYELPPIQRVGEHMLLDENGRPAPILAWTPGEATLVSFVYLSCPDACPTATATLAALDAKLAERPALARRVRLVTVSFDPARDTPERMAALHRSLAPRGRWSFATAASPAALQPALDDFGQDAAALPGDAAERIVHVLKVFLVDGEGRVRNVYSSGFLDVRLLLADLETVLGG
jgi:cytochrome oxidase Cu insertion factor (SCO1/SenC/PrrC family)